MVTLDMAQQLKAKNFDVKPDHMLCRQWITTAYENIINACFSDTEAEETPMNGIDEDALDDVMYEVHKNTKKTFHYEFGNGWRVSSKSTWCTATQSSYQRQEEIGQSCRHV